MGVPRKSLVVATFNYGATLCDETAQYLMDLMGELRAHPAIEDRAYRLPNINTTPIDMGRNIAVENALAHRADYLLMIDSDMAPDLYVDVQGKPHPQHPAAKRFFASSLDWMLDRPEPTVVAAPYCGPPPHENVYVFRWGNKRSGCPGPQFGLEQYSRFEAAGLTGIREAAALPTGLMLVDMRVFAGWTPPWFYYEFNRSCTEKQTTEDVAFSRDLLVRGFKGYCNWDAWAGHVKRVVVGKPTFVKPDDDVLGEIKKGMNFYRRVRQEVEPEAAPPAEPVNRVAAAVNGAGGGHGAGHAR